MDQYTALRAVRTLGACAIPCLRCVLCDTALPLENTSEICSDCYYETLSATEEGT
jgi:hypothetical protein